MDHKHGQRLHLERWLQCKDRKNYRHNVSKFFHTQKQPLLTSSLLLIAVLLLFGIFSTFLPPPTNTPPKGVTEINYSTFISQVITGNVLAVIIQGNEIQALLAQPLVRDDTSTDVPATKSSHSYTVDIATWNHYVISEHPAPPQARANNSFQSQNTSTPSIDPARAIYTHFPSSSHVHLIQLLLSNHVVISIHPTATPTPWLEQLLKNLLLILFFLIALRTITSSDSISSYHSKNGIAPRMLKDHAHLFERAKEKKEHQRKSAMTIDVDKNTNPSQRPSVTFADVAGIDEARIELEEIVQFLRSPERFERLGARIPRGALLIGPPGTGKTLLAKAVAGEAGVPFFSISASEFVEMVVGIGASRVRTLFKQARQSAPCVIFIDELDAVGGKRSLNITGNAERDQTLNQLLVELDGFDARKTVIVLGATNRVDMLDKALLRPARFDRQITVSLPDRIGREAILKVHTRSTPLHQDVSLERIARLTTGMSGADLANLVNEAALSAARQNLEQLTPASFEEAFSRIQLGMSRPLMMSETDQHIIAIHESGHALVAYHLPEADTVNRITILPRGQTLGVTQFTSEEDHYNLSRAALMTRIAVGLGGRIAEELVFGPERVTTGAENDFQLATDLARRMVTRWGMSEQVGVIFADSKHGGSSLNMGCIDRNAIQPQTHSLAIDNTGQLSLNDNHIPAAPRYPFMQCIPTVSNNSTTLATIIDLEVQRILNEAHAIAHALLSQHYDQLTRLAYALLEYEQLDHEQFEALLSRPTSEGDQARLPTHASQCTYYC